MLLLINQRTWSKWRGRSAYKLRQVALCLEVGRTTQNFETTNGWTNSRSAGEAFSRRAHSKTTGNRLLLLGEWIRVSNDNFKLPSIELGYYGYGQTRTP